ncbi:GntR family transcriptional regulator [Erysipelothrix urinaevulpis]|uniref:GntR family transcriptional regulator n=1 Tax=Erysipelothrix urinaevulpis TaxID=2683717 RepID=UPI001358467B|nr:GntR family transcriptional regulator [Erysipelothrix urinaevulpis]
MGIPIYQRIKNDIIEEIKDKPANSPLLSERDLAVQHGASRMTVRRAVNDLVEEGYLYRDSNKGTFIADKKLIRKNTLQQSEHLDYKIFYFDLKASSSNEVQDILGIGPNDQIIRMIRIMLDDKKPVAVEEFYASRNRLTDEEVDNLRDWKKLDEAIAQYTTNYRFNPIIVPMKYARMLEVPINSPMIMTESVVTNKLGKTILYIKTFNNPQERVIEITS